MMEEVLVPVFVVGMLFIGLPWLIMHYVTKWKQSPGGMTTEDEALLDELHSLAKRLEDRVNTVERIVAADNPDFRPGIADYRSEPDYRLKDRNLRRN
jgi:phage shock protein B